jgi:hypothetical protein
MFLENQREMAIAAGGEKARRGVRVGVMPDERYPLLFMLNSLAGLHLLESTWSFIYSTTHHHCHNSHHIVHTTNP